MTIGSQPLFPDARRSHLLRIIVVGVLVVVLQIPVLMIDGLIRERRARRDQAVEEVASKWGRRQAVTGPVLVVPYFRHWTEQGAGGSRIERAETNHATFLPESLTIRGRLQAEVRRRGIFSIPVYRATLQAEGAFTRPDLAQWGVEDHDVDWEHARVVLGIDDTRALRAPTAIEWNGARAEMVPGTGQFSGSSTGLHSEVAVPKDASRIGFSFPLELNGSAGAYWTPSGKITRVQLSSNWQSPSFQGNWLPLEHSISRNGFDAEWSVPYLGRNFPQAWRNDEVPHSTIEASRFGVDLIPSVDHYQMAERSVKYAALFLLLTFATLWLVEVLGAVPVHPIQYLLVGFALCIFYLLELSLSEHLGFGLAYLVATVAIVAQIAAYAAAILRGAARAAAVAGTVAMLYAYLYVLLTNEDNALLIGSVGVFLILGAIMYLTRRVDWYAPRPTP